MYQCLVVFSFILFLAGSISFGGSHQEEASRPTAEEPSNQEIDRTVASEEKTQDAKGAEDPVQSVVRGVSELNDALNTVNGYPKPNTD